jgi:hypothetical protein
VLLYYLQGSASKVRDNIKNYAWAGIHCCIAAKLSYEDWGWFGSAWSHKSLMHTVECGLKNNIFYCRT